MIRGLTMPIKGFDWDVYDYGSQRYVQRCDAVHSMSDEQAIAAAREAGYNVADDGRVLDARSNIESFDLFSADMDIARSLIERCCSIDDEDSYFDLAMFLEELTEAIECRRFETKKVGRFAVDATSIARYLWCCLALEEGDDPDGTMYRGVPILK